MSCKVVFDERDHYFVSYFRAKCSRYFQKSFGDTAPMSGGPSYARLMTSKSKGDIDMRKTLRAVSAAILAATCLVSQTACSSVSKKGAGNAEVVMAQPVKVEASDEPYYTSEIIDFEVPDPKPGIAWDSLSDPMYIDGKFYANYTYDDGSVDVKSSAGELRVYDDSGKLLETKDLDKVLKSKLDDCYYYLDTSRRIGNEFILNTFDSKSQTYEQQCYLYDFTTEEIRRFSRGDSKDEVYNSAFIELSDGSILIVKEGWNEASGETTVTFSIGDLDKETKSYKISDELKKKDVIYTGEYSYDPNSECINFMGYSENGGSYEVSFDIKSGELKEKEASVFDYFGRYVVDGVSYVINEDGIYSLKGEEKTPVCLFDSGNIARNQVMNSQLCYVSDDMIMLNGMRYDSFSSGQAYIIKLKKQDENPNVGKDLLTLAQLNYMDNSLENAIVKFNNESDSCFIKVITDYIPSVMDDQVQLVTPSDYENYYMTKTASLVDKLTIDLMSGDGPDMIMGTSGYSQLQKDEVLLDLSDYYDGMSNKDDLFTNVIEGCKKDGKLYSFPLDFSVFGISAPKKATGDRKGFTYDEYLDFVKKVCNGQDPILMYGMGRVDYSRKLLNNQADLFIKDDELNFNSKEFEELLTYVKTNVPERIYTNYEDQYIADAQVASDICVLNFHDYSIQMFGDGEPRALYGYPSSDGRGPLITIGTDFSIAAGSPNQDLAKEFLGRLTDPSYLNEMTRDNYVNVISTGATREAAVSRLKSLNGQSSEYDGLPGKKGDKFTEKDVDEYIDLLKSYDVAPSENPSINLIVQEEIPAFYADQKELSTISDAINNRAQTVLDEIG